MTKLPLTIVLAAAAAVMPDAQAAQPAVTITGTNGSFLDGNTRMLGWQFTVPQAVNVTSLGWFDWGQDGLNRSHEVGIWNSATQALVASVVVAPGTAAPLDGWFRWAELPAPVTLLAGVNYRIAGLDIGAGGDPHVWDNTISGYTAQVSGLALNPAVQMAGAGTAIGSVASAFGYPGSQIGDARGALFGPNLAVSAVPDPATWMLMLGGLGTLALHTKTRSRPAAHGAARHRGTRGRADRHACGERAAAV